MQPLLRDATPGDADAIAALYAAEVAGGVNTYEVVAPDAAEMARRIAAVQSAGYPWLVAECDGRIAGFAYASSFRARAAYRSTVEDSVYVAADAQGMGLGTALLAALVAACEARGFRQMVAVIGNAANHASLRLHARAGFHPIGTFPGIAWKHGRWLDTVFMQRPLGAGTAGPPDHE